MESLLLLGFYILTFYAFLPGLISRIFGFRVFKRGKAEREIALTFDDGPDPIYTPKLLDLLARYDAKATFFVVGANAERHPEILRRMIDEGHIIGIHNYVHKTNWFMRPATVKRQIHQTSEVIRKATGTRSFYYRPPWGIVNLFDFSNLGHLQIILWSAMFNDWRKRVGVKRLTKRMMKKLRPGEVLLLHDCGTTFGADHDAPAHMLEALEHYLQEGAKRGYRFVQIEEMIEVSDQRRARHAERLRTQLESRGARPRMGLLKRAAVALWLTWERIFQWVFRVKPVQGDAVFHYRIRKYHGPQLRLDDGETIRDGDEVVELHFDNRKLFETVASSGSVMRMAIYVVREVGKALPKLAAEMAGKPEFREVRGLYGISMINRGSQSFGFSTIDLPPGLFSRMTRLYLKLLLRVLHPGGNQRVREKKETLIPRIIAMSMPEFRRRYAAVPAETGWKLPDKRAPLKQEQQEEYEASEKAARELVP
ncbi:polysaccharide deacetylase family protein [Paenibacillus daejeonensis]|uniref:polysaccharide deacetylase family protein n=1 Tax=Paenibacillus daejeonensis TaxID=135193 RepID=UPI0003611DF7|nr:polysaccharide deacetylase family protein [Paenibacillus daejeonensis]